MRRRMLLNQIVASAILLSFLLALPLSYTTVRVQASQPAGLEEQKFPPDMPDTPYPEIKGCSPPQEWYLKDAWRLAHYYTWRAKKLMDFIFSHDEAQRAELWSRDYVAAKSSTVPSPRRWFGPYDSKRARKVRDAIEKAHSRFLRQGKYVEGIDVLRCGQPIGHKLDADTDVCPAANPGGDGPPSAYHFPIGVIVTCPSFWEGAKKVSSDPNALGLSARVLVHEIFHHLSVDGLYVDDTHGGEKRYGWADALDIAERRPEWAIYNNDNYAWFIYYVGRHEPAYDAIWAEKDPGGTGAFWVDLTWEGLTSKWNEYSSNQYLGDVETYLRNGERRFIGLWRVGKGAGALWLSPPKAFIEKFAELKKTQDLIDIEVYNEGNEWRYLGVYKKKDDPNSGNGGLLIGLTWEGLVKAWKDFSPNAHIVDVEPYVEGGQLKFIGVWRAGKGSGALYWFKNREDFENKKSELNPTQHLVDFKKFITADGQWNYLGVWHQGKSNGPLAQSIVRSDLLERWSNLKSDYTLVRVGEYSALPAMIK